MNAEKTHWVVQMPTAWPDPPAEMTVTTHTEINECPRRWALSAADYPSLWAGRGYPPKLQVAALAGSVVHLALEIITKQLTRSGVPTLSDPTAPQVLRNLGGYTRVVESCLDRILKRYVENPRAIGLMEYATRTLRGQVPMLRARVQAMLARLHLSTPTKPTPEVPMEATSTAARNPLKSGTYLEVELRAKSIGWKGKADLLVLGADSCQITDFKTGIASEAHKLQVRVYAVLWRLDNDLNPTGRLADRLVLTYENRDVEVAAPVAEEIEALRHDLLARRHASEGALAARPPEARPSPENCRYCCVRQLCDAYWTGASLAISDDGRFGDVELRISSQHGPTSWDAIVIRARDFPPNMPALLRLQQPDDFAPGSHIRVLDGGFARDPENPTGPLIVTLGSFSEAYRAE
ncbi:MAG: PD-(D/E)XK nuclease family protein [Pseudomonadota bacterium]|nr:PD-(D/E)XK nuclease family protein [Pseudomonadota bacterium]